MSNPNLSRLQFGRQARSQNLHASAKSLPRESISKFFVKQASGGKNKLGEDADKPSLSKRPAEVSCSEGAKRPKISCSPTGSSPDRNQWQLCVPTILSPMLSKSMSASMSKLQEFSKDSLLRQKDDKGIPSSKREERRTENAGGTKIIASLSKRTVATDACPRDVCDPKETSKGAALNLKSPNSLTKCHYTPLELQFLEVKSKYSDAVLFVECGYKYRFFGKDAEIAARELNIMCHLDHNFMTASIPVHRLHVHVKRLVSKGYKVGVVKQTETAALKAAGENRSKVFTRELHALYTKATLVGEDMKSSMAQGTDSSESLEVDAGYLMCLYEAISQDSKATTAVTRNSTYGIVAVNPSSGDIVYDEFQDGLACSELEFRMAHIQPVELLLPEKLSDAAESFLSRYVSQSQSRPEDAVRLERLPPGSFQPARATQCISEFYQGDTTEVDTELFKTQVRPREGTDSHTQGEELSQVPGVQAAIRLPKTVQVCFAAVIRYLEDFKLEKVLRLTSNATRFAGQTKCMKLNGCTVRNLEIFRNQTDGGQKGSLFWVINHTSTPFGKRLLKKWLSQPLMEPREIDERLEAVTELLEPGASCLARLTNLLARMPDLDRGLCTMYHKKCSPGEFVTIAKALAQLGQELKSCLDAAAREVSSALLQPIFRQVPECLESVRDFLNLLDEKAAKSGDKTKLFCDESKFPEIMKSNQEIERILGELAGHRSVFRRALRQPALDYCCVSGNEFLIEVRNTNLRIVPSDWINISSTKQVSRFRTPFVAEHHKLLNQQREQLALACQQAWLHFLASFNQNYAKYHRAVHLVAQLDCLLSLATVAKQPGFVRPVVGDSGAHIHIKQGRHPIIDALLPENEQFVPNDTRMDTENNRCMIITGPNMGGKSSYIKQVALICVLAQLGSYVPAESAELGVLDAVYTRMGAADNIYKGRSTFMVELQEASEIIDLATSQSLVILDELGRGTSTHDGVAIAYATLEHFITKVQSLTLFVTHYPSLAELQTTFPRRVSNNHMAFMTSEEAGTSTDASGSDAVVGSACVPSVTFLYQLVKGAAARSYGLNVACLAGIPGGILEAAAAKSHQLETEISIKRRSNSVFKELFLAPKRITDHVRECRELGTRRGGQ